MPEEEQGPIVPEEDNAFSEFGLDTLSLDKVAICVWPMVGLRQEPGRKRYTKDGENNYLEAILYGEKVELLPGEEPVEVDNRTYIKVRLRDGQEGWVHDFLFEQYGQLGVITQPTEIYRRPDLMTLRDKKYEPGEIVVIIRDPQVPQVGNWYHVSTREKSPKGWIHQGHHISMHVRDVKAALLLSRARNISNKEKKREKLLEILDIPDIEESPIKAYVDARIKELDGEEYTEEPEKENDGGKLFIAKSDVSLHSEPTNEKENIIKQLSEDDICLVLDIGARDAIGNMTDYWYRIRHDDDEGWVFGYYTSMRDLQ